MTSAVKMCNEVTPWSLVSLLIEYLLVEMDMWPGIHQIGACETLWQIPQKSLATANADIEEIVAGVGWLAAALECTLEFAM